VFGLPATIAVVTNVELDHHSEFSSLAELEAQFARWTSSAPQVVRDAGPFDGSLAVPGEHNRRNAGAALAALELAGVGREEAAAALGRFTGTGRRFEVSEAGGVTIVDDYGHHPTELAAAIATVRELYPGRRLHVLFQPHLYSRTRHLAAELAGALAVADVVAVTEIYAAREEPVAGVTGKLVVDALAEQRAGMPLAWTPQADDGARFLAAHARRGDRALTIGAGDVDRAAPLLLELLA
jgi:UDP-N-acetylmuramate--alanine ligase